jgi:Bacterial SH3 domain
MKPAATFALRLIIAALVFVLCVTTNSFAGTHKAIVTATSLNVRSGPTTENRVVGSIYKDDIVTILDESDGWAQVETDEGIKGWAAARFLEPVDDDGKSDDSKQVSGDRASSVGSDNGSGGFGGLGGIGGVSLRKAAKWGCLAGGAIFCYMAYSAKSGADDDYEEYKRVFEDSGADAAEPYFQDAEDGDAAAQTRLIVGGLFMGLFALQQWVLDDPADGTADAVIELGRGGTVQLSLLRFRN